MSGMDMSRAQGSNYNAAEMELDETPSPAEMADEEDVEDDVVKVARRSVRKFPEESRSLLAEREQEQVPITRLSCDCPEVLTKGTLAAIVAALAFLGFFSTSVLLVVSFWIIRLLGKQKKAENSDFKRPLPPIPPPRPEHTYGNRRRSSHPYEELHPAHQSPPEGVYLSASEINPGPRMKTDHTYDVPRPILHGTTSSPENEYVAPSFTPPEQVYSSLQRSSGVKIASPSGSPTFHTSSPGYHGGSPGFQGSSPTMPSGSPVGSPGSPN